MRLILTLPLALLILLSTTPSTILSSNPSNSDYSHLPTPQLHSLASTLISTNPNQALGIYDILYQRDNNDWQTVYKRAMVRLAMGKLGGVGGGEGALEGFQESLKLRDWDQAHVQIAKIHLKQGSFSLATSALSSLPSSHPDLKPLKSQISLASSRFSAAKKARRKGKFEDCVKMATEVLDISMNSVEGRKLRSGCWIGLAAKGKGKMKEGGEKKDNDEETSRSGFDVAELDLLRAASLSTSLPPSLLIRATLLSLLYPTPHALSSLTSSPTLLAPLKACLHSDPEQKDCLKAHRLVKKLEKELSKLRNLVEAASSGGNEAAWRRVGSVLVGEEIVKGKKMVKDEKKAGEDRDNEGGAVRMLRDLIDVYSDLEALKTSKNDNDEESADDPEDLVIFPKGLLGNHPSTLMTHLVSLTCKSLLSTTSSSSPSSPIMRRSQPYCRKTQLLIDHHKRVGDFPDSSAGGGVGTEWEIWSLIGSAEGDILEERWDDAGRGMERAFELGGRRDRGVGERVGRVRKLVKVSKQKDYYKILGVGRDADAKTIKRAYRKATLKAHPDKGGTEQLMAEVNQAYEVLSNPELKARFDRGEDPMDPTSGQQSPFQQGPGGGFGGMPSHVFQQFFQGGSGGFPGGHGHHGGQTFQFKWGG